MNAKDTHIIAEIKMPKDEIGYAFRYNYPFSEHAMKTTLKDWQDPLFHPRWYPGTNWSFTPDECKTAFQSIKTGGDAILLNRNENLTNYRISASIRFFSANAEPTAGNGRVPFARTGLIFRFQNFYSYYFFCAEKAERFVLYRREDMINFHELASFIPEDGFQQENYHHLSIGGEGSSITCTVNGKTVIQYNDNHFNAGKAGLRASGFASFRDIRIETSAKNWKHCQAYGVSKKKTLANLREQHLQPSLAKTIELPYNFQQLQFVDFRNIGKKEIIGIRKDESTNKQVLTALTLDGHVLWESSANLFWGNMGVFRISDIDLDGRKEIVTVPDGKIRIQKADTGEICAETTVYAPGPMMDFIEPNKYPKVLTYSWYFPRLQGPNHPRDILFMDCLPSGGWNIWAYDNNLNLRFHKFNEQPQHGHHACCLDINNDGHDEILIGSRLLDCEGNQIWLAEGAKEMDYFGPGRHVDNVSAGYKTDNPEDGYFVAMSAGDDGLLILNGDNGKIIKCNHVGHAQGHCIAKFRNDIPGDQAWSITRHHGLGVMNLIDSQGQILQQFQSDFHNDRANSGSWKNVDENLLFFNNTPSIAGLWDAQGNHVIPIPKEELDFIERQSKSKPIPFVLMLTPFLGQDNDFIIRRNRQIRVFSAK